MHPGGASAMRIGRKTVARAGARCRLDHMETPETSRPSVLADIQQRVSELLRSSPAADLERNLKALVVQTFERFDLVTRDELDAHRAVIDSLEARIAELERALEPRDSVEPADSAPEPDNLAGEPGDTAGSGDPDQPG